MHWAEPDCQVLWDEVRFDVRLGSGVPVLDDYRIYDKVADGKTMDDLGQIRRADASWKIEEYHCGLKQTTTVKQCQCRVGRAKRGHIDSALYAFVVLERYCFKTSVNWLTAKWQILHDAIRAYRASPHYRLPGSA